MSEGKMFLSINQCPMHREFYSVSVDHETNGLRITPNKCCGQWKEVKRWPMNREQLRAIAEMILQEAGR